MVYKEYPEINHQLFFIPLLRFRIGNYVCIAEKRYGFFLCGLLYSLRNLKYIYSDIIHNTFSVAHIFLSISLHRGSVSLICWLSNRKRTQFLSNTGIEQKTPARDFVIFTTKSLLASHFCVAISSFCFNVNCGWLLVSMWRENSDIQGNKKIKTLLFAGGVRNVFCHLRSNASKNRNEYEDEKWYEDCFHEKYTIIMTYFVNDDLFPLY